MAIKHFTFDRLLTDSFIRFGYDQYRDDANWIPPLKGEIHKQLSPDYPFYRKKGNAHRHFLATCRNKTVGRISAMVNSDLKEKDETPVGILGFFECVSDPVVASALLGAAIQWLHDKHGLKRIWGPVNFDIWHSYRFMTKGYNQKLFYGEPYNKPYYPEFFEHYGFLPKKRWDSVEITHRDALEQMATRGKERYQMLIDQGYHFEHFKVHEFSKELRKLHRALTNSFKEFLGFTPISFEEFERLFSKSRYALNPQMCVFVYDEKNNLAGFEAAVLELSDAIRAMNGKENFMSKLKFLYSRRSINRINFYAAGLTPEEMAKKSGLGRAALYYFTQQALNEGYENVIFALMAKDNSVNRLLRRYSKEIQREYTLYELNI